jgi:hypothetical protein
MSKLSHFLENRLTDGSEVVSSTRQPLFIPQEDSWYSFLLEAESTPRAIVRLEGLGKLKKSTSSGLDPAPFLYLNLKMKILREIVLCSSITQHENYFAIVTWIHVNMFSLTNTFPFTGT